MPGTLTRPAGDDSLHICLLSTGFGLRFMRSALVLLAGLVLLACPLPPARAEQDVSLVGLVVANSKYNKDEDDGLGELAEAAVDGKKVAEHLRKLGFPLAQEFERADFKIGGFDQDWQSFLARSRAIDNTKGLAVFYYSGHGVEVGADSLLVPIDMRRSDPDSSYLQNGVRLQTLLADFNKVQLDLKAAGKTLHGLFIFDACRRPAKADQSKKGSFGLPPLTPAPAFPGMMVLYAASRGQVAHTKLEMPPGTQVAGNQDASTKDRPGGSRSTQEEKPAAPAEPTTSVFTGALLRALTPNLALQTVASAARRDVYNLVNKAKRGVEQQFPAIADELTERITILGTPAVENEQKVGPVFLAPSGGQPRDKDDDVYFNEGAIVWECDDCPDLVVLPASKFKMGSPPEEPGRNANEQRIEITLPRPFAMGRSEVTRKQFRVFLDAQCKAGNASCATGSDAREPGEDRPVGGVTWREARAYVGWLNSLPTARQDVVERGRYRLPSEAEWEYAARAGARGRFVGDVDLRGLCAYGNGADASLRAFFDANKDCNDGKAVGVTAAVSYKPNAFGLYGVHGNLWEWVADCWREANDARNAGGTMNGTLDDNDCRRVVRGGSWRSGPDALRFAKRLSFAADHRRPTIGFRVLREITDAELKRTAEAGTQAQATQQAAPAP